MKKISLVLAALATIAIAAPAAAQDKMMDNGMHRGMGMHHHMMHKRMMMHRRHHMMHHMMKKEGM
jgi:hypothetical protein